MSNDRLYGALILPRNVQTLRGGSKHYGVETTNTNSDTQIPLFVYSYLFFYYSSLFII